MITKVFLIISTYDLFVFFLKEIYDYITIYLNNIKPEGTLLHAKLSYQNIATMIGLVYEKGTRILNHRGDWTEERN